MLVVSDHVDITLNGGPLRVFVAEPREPGKYPGILFDSDIFQLTGPMIRACVRLAGYGFVVAAPEIYHRVEPPGTVIPFDDPGRTRGLDDAAKTSLAEFDETGRAVLDFLASRPNVAAGKLGAAGFCIGGHLAFRAALQPDVRATACFYATGVHSGKLGSDGADTLSHFGDIHGELLAVFGQIDPHVPEEGRRTIANALKAAGTRHEIKLYRAEHAFMRDEGPRFDPEATDLAWADMIALFRRVLA